jgi:hypothetical protein
MSPPDVVDFRTFDDYRRQIGYESKTRDHRPKVDGPKSQPRPEQPDRSHGADRVIDVFVDVVGRDGAPISEAAMT